jgi:hypothetical protein
MTEVPETAKSAARAAKAVFGGVFRVTEYLDESEEHAVDVLTCENAPRPGYWVNSTVNLHLAPNVIDGVDRRVELALVTPSTATVAPNVIATAAFNISKSGWIVAPGVVYPDILTAYGLPDDLPHLMWSWPFDFEELGEVDLGEGVYTHWLVGVPISEAERRFLLSEGFDKLEDRFVDAGIRYQDLDRPSVV